LLERMLQWLRSSFCTTGPQGDSDYPALKK